MSCTKHFLMFEWTKHNWRQSASWADTYASRDTDMWGRTVSDPYVVCQPQYQCRDCGKELPGPSCTCDKDYAAQCPRRGQDRVSQAA